MKKGRKTDKYIQTLGVYELELPICVLVNKNLSPASKLLFTLILNSSGEYGTDECINLTKHFANVLSLSIKNADKAINELAEQKYILKYFTPENDLVIKTNPDYRQIHSDISSTFNEEYVWGEG